MMVASEADEAWWPPTFRPSVFSRRWLALWMVQLASQSTFFSSARRMSRLSAMDVSLARNTRAGKSHGQINRSARAMVQRWSEARLLVLAGASSTVLQAGGRSAMVNAGFGLAGFGLGLGCNTLSENQEARS